MKWLPLGLLVLAGYWLWTRRPTDRLSADWLELQRREGMREEFHGVSWKWPVRKEW